MGGRALTAWTSLLSRVTRGFCLVNRRRVEEMGASRMRLACATAATCVATFWVRLRSGDPLAQRASCGLGRRPPVFIITALGVGPDILGFGDGDGLGVGFGVKGSVDGT
jgi:hypothetical protein